MQKSPFGQLKTSRMLSSSTSSFVGVVIILGVVLFLSSLMTKVDVSEQVVTVMSSISLCIGAYSAGVTATRNRRENRIVVAILTGVFVYCLIFFLGVMFAKTSINFNAFTKLIMTIICVAIGCIIGCKAKSKRY